MSGICRFMSGFSRDLQIRKWGFTNHAYLRKSGLSQWSALYIILCKSALYLFSQGGRIFLTSNLKLKMSEVSSGLTCAKHVILILSGKGGVGKSTVAVHLALKLQQMGKKVGLLDVDLCGPSIPFMLNLSDHGVYQCEQGWLPVFTDASQTLGVMSIGFILKNKDDAVPWRGPKKTAMIRQFVNDVVWQDVDYLIIDTPPGTSDEHLAVMESLKSCKVDGAVLVTTPQAVSVNDVRREATFCKKGGVQLLGIIENMSGFVCPSCQECTNIFSQGGGEKLADYVKTTFLGRIPIDMALSYLVERKLSSIEDFNKSPVSKTIEDITKLILSKTEENS